MMEKDFSPIDKFFNKKLSDYEVSNKKGNWELVRHLIKEQQQKATFFRKLKLMILGSVGVVFIFSMTLFLYNSSKKTSNLLVNKETNISEYQEHISSNSKQKESFNEPKITHSTNSNKVVQSVINQPPSQADFPNEKHPPTAKNSNTLKKNTLHNKNYSKNYIDNNIYPKKPTKVPPNLQVQQNNNNADAYYSVIPAERHFTIDKDSIKIEITNLGSGVNSAFIDYGPVVTADGETMYFTSSRPISKTDEKKREKKTYQNIYSSTFSTKAKKWGNTQILPSSINEKERNNSVIGLSNDGQRMFLYRDNNKGVGDIYESTLSGLKWSKPVMLPKPINSKYHESSASLSPDGKTIYFTSERPGGLGKSDIWFCKQNKDGKWEQAININALNTPEDEDGVFIHPDGKTIYFSSKRAGGFGGYDIYKSVFDKGKWSKPQNLGQPLNTANDDIYFVMEANGKIGYYASRKSGGLGDADIYKVAFLDEISKPKLTLLKGIVSDKNNKPLNALIKVYDTETKKVVSTFKSNSSTGKYMISLLSGHNYEVNVVKEGYFFHPEKINVSEEDEFKELVINIKLTKIEAGKKVLLKNIFYDYKKTSLRADSYDELDKIVELLKVNPTIKIEISAHSDSRGGNAYNKKLSQERAQSCVNYLQSKGVNKSRLIAKGYGESHPIASNQNADGSDNPEGRQLNRRTEFKILEIGKVIN